MGPVKHPYAAAKHWAPLRGLLFCLPLLSLAQPKPETAPKAKAAAKPDGGKTKVWFVQAGAFAQESNAQNVRLKLEGAGLQTLAESLDTKSGKLIRVRVGPFTTKAEAENASLQIKALDLPAVLFRE